MFLPDVLPWMIECYHLTSLRVDAADFRRFVSVTPLAGEGEVSSHSQAMQNTRLDVLNRETFGGIGFRALAILAAPVCPCGHELPQSFRNRFSHAQSSQYQILPTAAGEGRRAIVRA